jgi:hypothetical protein
VGGCGLGSSGSEAEPITGFCEHDNAVSVFIKVRAEDSVPWS